MVILLLAVAVRVFAIRTAGFDYDQEYAANFAWRVVNEYPIQMIGQNLSVEGLFMGPLYFYFLIPFYLITNLHPIGGVIGSIVLGLITIVVYFYIFKSVFGLKTALIASFLRATLFSFVAADLTVTPAFSADLPVLLTWFCFYKFWNNKLIYLIPLSFLFGLYTSYHPILFPFYLVFLIILVLKRTLPSWKIVVISFIVFLIPISPLIRFEYHHDFLEVKRLFSLESAKSDPTIVRNFSRFMTLINFSFIDPVFIFFGNFYHNFQSYLGKSWGGIFYLPLVILMFLRLNFWKNKFHSIVFISTYIIFILYYFFLPILLTEYYLFGIHTLFFVYAVASFSLLKSRLILLLAIALLTIFNFDQLNQVVSRTNGATLYDKERIVSQIKANTSDNEQFFVSYITLHGGKFGYPYLFKIYNRVPSNDPQPRTFNIVSPKSLVGDQFDFQSGDIGLILPKDN